MRRISLPVLAALLLLLAGCGGDTQPPIKKTSDLTAEEKQAIAEHDRMIDLQEGGDRSKLKKK